MDAGARGSDRSVTTAPVQKVPTKRTGTTNTSGSSEATTTTVPPGLPAEKCPAAKTCRRYGYVLNPPVRWPVGPNGRATIHYRVYPQGSQTALSADQITRDIAEALATWQAAAPTLEFVFDGTTSNPPVAGDGVNTIGFSPTNIFTNVKGEEGVIREADMFLGPSPYVSYPCEQRDNSCTQLHNSGEGFDLQGIVTHEAGHFVGLGDMNDTALERELTMHPGSGSQTTSTDRFWVTLALGDVLGIRSLYPCSCPLPPIYSP